jgi:hypothetical protein
MMPDQSEAAIPPELLQPPPRRIQLRADGRKAMNAVLILLLMDLAALTCPFWGEILIFNAPVIQAKVTNRWESQGRRSTFYHVEFYVDPQKNIRDDDTTDWSTYDQAKPGTTLPVRSVSIFGFRYSRIGSSVWELCYGSSLFIIAVTCNVMMSPAFPIGIYFWLKARKLIKYGQPAVATIVDYVKDKSFLVTYEFESAIGPIRKTQSFKDAHPVRSGQKIVAIYNPADPQYCALYPFHSYEAIL